MVIIVHEQHGVITSHYKWAGEHNTQHIAFLIHQGRQRGEAKGMQTYTTKETLVHIEGPDV